MERTERSHPPVDVHPELEPGTIVTGRMMGWDDPERDLEEYGLSPEVRGPLFKQYVESLDYWQYGVLDEDQAVSVVEPDSIRAADEEVRYGSEVP